MPKPRAHPISDASSSSSSTLASESDSDTNSEEDQGTKRNNKIERKNKGAKTTIPPRSCHASSSRLPNNQNTSPTKGNEEHTRDPPITPHKPLSRLYQKASPTKTPLPAKRVRDNYGRKSSKKQKIKSTDESDDPPTPPIPATPVVSSPIPGKTYLEHLLCTVPDCRARPFTNTKTRCPSKALELHLRTKGRLGSQEHADAYVDTLEARMLRQGKRYAMEATIDIKDRMGEVAWEEMVHQMGMRYLYYLDLDLYFKEIRFGGEEDMDYE